ncbi:hypothetical protein ABZV75_10640 [Streptomyces flaveolus]|uniref:hypothetical protein n=1 Tax=Streptomyces flaveolus TaxID=67297 RepID=UPI0033AD2488
MHQGGGGGQPNPELRAGRKLLHETHGRRCSDEGPRPAASRDRLRAARLAPMAGLGVHADTEPAGFLAAMDGCKQRAPDPAIVVSAWRALSLPGQRRKSECVRRFFGHWSCVAGGGGVVGDGETLAVLERLETNLAACVRDAGTPSRPGAPDA